MLPATLFWQILRKSVIRKHFPSFLLPSFHLVLGTVKLCLSCKLEYFKTLSSSYVFPPYPGFSLCFSAMGLRASHSTQSKAGHVSVAHHYHKWKQVTWFPTELESSGLGLIEKVFGGKKRGHDRDSVNIFLLSNCMHSEHKLKPAGTAYDGTTS